MSNKTYTFISYDKSPSFVMRHGFADFNSNSGGLMQARWPAVIRFRAIAGKPIYTEALSNDKAIARGMVNTNQIMNDLEQAGWTNPKLPASERITLDDVLEFMRNHKSYGSKFVMIGETGTEESREGYIVPRGIEGKFYCRLCKKEMVSQGVKGHCRGNLHKAAVEKAEAAGKAPESPQNWEQVASALG